MRTNRGQGSTPDSKMICANGSGYFGGKQKELSSHPHPICQTQVRPPSLAPQSSQVSDCAEAREGEGRPELPRSRAQLPQRGDGPRPPHLAAGKAGCEAGEDARPGGGSRELSTGGAWGPQTEPLSQKLSLHRPPSPQPWHLPRHTVSPIPQNFFH